MKKTLRTMMLAAAGVLGSVAVAQAQPAPPPPPAPPTDQPPAPPAAQPPPVEFGVAPAALPAAPVASQPVPTVSWGAQPGTDTTTPAPEKKQNPFFFTRLTWGNTASTKIFGVGGSYIGTEDEQYSMDFTLNLRYYVLNQTLDKIYLNASLGVSTELTNSDTTPLKHEPLFRDIAVSAGYSRTVYRNADKTVVTTPSISAGLTLPTSKASRAQGKYLSTSINAGVAQLLPLAGPKSDWFSDVFIIGIVGWSHLFSQGFTAENEIAALQRPRQAPDGNEYRSEQLSMSSFAANNVRLSATYYLTIYKDLSLGNTWEVLMPFKREFTGTSVSLPTGPVAVGASAHPLNPTTTFDIGLSYVLFNTARIDVGYQNVSSELGEDGKRRSVFYSPDSSFYGNVSLYIDTLLDKAMNASASKKTAAPAPTRFGRGAF